MFSRAALSSARLVAVSLSSAGVSGGLWAKFGVESPNKIRQVAIICRDDTAVVLLQKRLDLCHAFVRHLIDSRLVTFELSALRVQLLLRRFQFSPFHLEFVAHSLSHLLNSLVEVLGGLHALSLSALVVLLVSPPAYHEE